MSLCFSIGFVILQIWTTGDKKDDRGSRNILESMLGKMSKYRKDTRAIVLMVIFGCVVMAYVDAVIRPPYVVKSVVKVLLFLGLPVLYACLAKDNKLDLKSLVVPKKKGFFTALFLGMAVYAVILGAYFALRGVYDFTPITGMLNDNVGVRKDNFVWVALYISFCNSLLEEFFFRGIAFLALAKSVGKRNAYLFSSVMFAVYHVAIMTGWFSPILFLLAMAGLMAGACIFNFLDSKTENIYNSWMVHMFANFAINTVGMILFGIL